MNIKEDRNQLHSALADLVTFLEKNPHPMGSAISTYMKDAIDAIQNCTIGEDKECGSDCDCDTAEVVVTETLLNSPMIEKLKYEVPSQDDEIIKSVVSALKILGYGVREATNLAVSVTGDTVEERIKNALSSSSTLRPSHGSD